jgi:hypothetical protein
MKYKAFLIDDNGRTFDKKYSNSLKDIKEWAKGRGTEVGYRCKVTCDGLSEINDECVVLEFTPNGRTQERED